MSTMRRLLAASVGGTTEEIEITFVLTLVLVLSLSGGVRMLDRRVRRHKHISDMLGVMYKELMILVSRAPGEHSGRELTGSRPSTLAPCRQGIVAFALFAVTAADTDLLSSSSKHVFEQVHNSLFVVALLYATSVLLLARLSLRTSHRWSHIERLDFERWRVMRDEFQQLAPRFRHHLLASLRHPMQWWRMHSLLEIVKFHELRYLFLRANSLTNAFKFAMYLKKCKQVGGRSFGGAGAPRAPPSHRLVA